VAAGGAEPGVKPGMPRPNITEKNAGSARAKAR
jgi:hypothetical protein